MTTELNVSAEDAVKRLGMRPDLLRLFAAELQLSAHDRRWMLQHSKVDEQVLAGRAVPRGDDASFQGVQ